MAHTHTHPIKHKPKMLYLTKEQVWTLQEKRHSAVHLSSSQKQWPMLHGSNIFNWQCAIVMNIGLFWSACGLLSYVNKKMAFNAKKKLLDIIENKQPMICQSKYSTNNPKRFQYKTVWFEKKWFFFEFKIVLVYSTTWGFSSVIITWKVTNRRFRCRVRFSSGEEFSSDGDSLEDFFP